MRGLRCCRGMAVQRPCRGTRGRGGAPPQKREMKPKGMSGRETFVGDLGLLTSAKKLFAHELRRELGVYRKRRVVEKRGFWDLRTMHAKYRALPEDAKAEWAAKAEALNRAREILRREILRSGRPRRRR